MKRVLVITLIVAALLGVVLAPAHKHIFWATVASDNTKDMLVGEGYWVFMTDSATLAGFEVTPIYWINLP